MLVLPVYNCLQFIYAVCTRKKKTVFEQFQLIYDLNIRLCMEFFSFKVATKAYFKFAITY